MWEKSIYHLQDNVQYIEIIHMPEDRIMLTVHRLVYDTIVIWVQLEAPRYQCTV